MRLRYDPETDSLYIELSEHPSTDSVEVAEGIVLDVDADGHAVGIDIQHAGETLDLRTLEAEGVPLAG